MRRLPLTVVFLCGLVLGGSLPTSAQGTPSCADYDAWEWAQSVFESDPQRHDALDPDGALPAQPHPDHQRLGRGRRLRRPHVRQGTADAAAFAKRHELGVYAQCGAFELPLRAAPAAAPQEPVNDQPAQEPQGEAPAPPVQETEPEAPAGGCDPNYTPCVPISPTDLDCADIGFSVTIIGSDPHGFDGNDNDGLGCESY